MYRVVAFSIVTEIFLLEKLEERNAIIPYSRHRRVNTVSSMRDDRRVATNRGKLLERERERLPLPVHPVHLVAGRANIACIIQGPRRLAAARGFA